MPFLVFRFNGEPVPGHYRIVVNTIYQINDTAYWDNSSLQNSLYWRKSATSFGQSQWSTYAYLGKITKTAPATHNNQITWKIAVTSLNIYIGSTMVWDYKDASYIEDTLPKGLRFVAAAWDNPTPDATGEDAVTPIITAGSNGTTKLRFEAKPNASLYILTEYDGDYTKLTTAQTYTNDAKLYFTDETGTTRYMSAKMHSTATE